MFFKRKPPFFQNVNFRIYLHRLLDGLPGDNTRGLDTDTLPGLGSNGSSPINGVTQSIDNTTKELRADGDIDNGTGTLDNIAFLDQLVITLDKKFTSKWRTV